MISSEIIKKMTFNELSYYIGLLHDEEISLRKMLQTQDAMINALLSMYNESSRKTDAQISLNVKGGNKAQFEHDMEQRYGEDECKTYEPDIKEY